MAARRAGWRQRRCAARTLGRRAADAHAPCVRASARRSAAAAACQPPPRAPPLAPSAAAATASHVPASPSPPAPPSPHATQASEPPAASTAGSDVAQAHSAAAACRAAGGAGSKSSQPMGVPPSCDAGWPGNCAGCARTAVSASGSPSPAQACCASHARWLGGSACDGRAHHKAVLRAAMRSVAQPKSQQKRPGMEGSDMVLVVESRAKSPRHPAVPHLSRGGAQDLEHKGSRRKGLRRVQGDNRSTSFQRQTEFGLPPVHFAAASMATRPRTLLAETRDACPPESPIGPPSLRFYIRQLACRRPPPPPRSAALGKAMQAQAIPAGSGIRTSPCARAVYDTPCVSHPAAAALDTASRPFSAASASLSHASPPPLAPSLASLMARASREPGSTAASKWLRAERVIIVV
jgi:hypothetical protein